uniref:Uncharacterized protein n=1 Tax=Arundo donax TaxID=35708 RepID=A0A0A9G582_ARUDO
MLDFQLSPTVNHHQSLSSSEHHHQLYQQGHFRKKTPGVEASHLLPRGKEAAPRRCGREAEQSVCRGVAAVKTGEGKGG